MPRITSNSQVLSCHPSQTCTWLLTAVLSCQRSVGLMNMDNVTKYWVETGQDPDHHPTVPCLHSPTATTQPAQQNPPPAVDWARDWDVLLCPSAFGQLPYVSMREPWSWNGIRFWKLFTNYILGLILSSRSKLWTVMRWWESSSGLWGVMSGQPVVCCLWCSHRDHWSRALTCTSSG